MGLFTLDITDSHHFFPRISPARSQNRTADRILKQVDATTYLSGPAAQVYLEPEIFEQAGIRLEYKLMIIPNIEQLYPPYDPAVSVIDLLFMVGKDLKAYL